MPYLYHYNTYSSAVILLYIIKEIPQRHRNLLMMDDAPPFFNNTKNTDQSEGKDHLSTAMTRC